MNKKNLIEQMLIQLQAEVEMLEASAKSASSAATHEESKPENKYDTRGLEASYLAGAQTARIEQVKSGMALLQQMQLKAFAEDDAIAPSAIIELESGEQKSFVFLVVSGAGLQLRSEGLKLVAVTTSSPMGKGLIGKFVGDFATIKIGDSLREYEIVSVE